MIKKNNLKIKFFSKILKIFSILFLIFFLSYSLEDLLKDIQIISDPRMNIAQKEAAIMRINLFLNSREKDDLYKDIYVLYIDFGYEKIKNLFLEIKKFFPLPLYNDIIAYIEKLYKEQVKDDKISSSGNQDSQENKNQQQSNIQPKNEKNEENKKEDKKEENKKNESSTPIKTDKIETKDIPPKVTIEDILKKYGVINSNIQSKEINTNKDQTQKIINEKIEKKYSFEELELIFRQGITSYSQKEYDIALEKFLITLKNEYNSLSSSYYIALIYEIKIEYDKAIDFFILSINIIQKSGKIDFRFLSFLHKKIGILYSLKKDFFLSKKYLIKALEYNMNDGDIYYWLGFLYYSEGDYQSALEYWKRGSNLNNQKCYDAYKWLTEKMKNK